eukprot:g1893.t1
MTQLYRSGCVIRAWEMREFAELVVGGVSYKSEEQLEELLKQLQRIEVILPSAIPQPLEKFLTQLCPQIQVLVLVRCELSRIANLGGLPHLTVLNLKENKLRTLQNMFEGGASYNILGAQAAGGGARRASTGSVLAGSSMGATPASSWTGFTATSSGMNSADVNVAGNMRKLREIYLCSNLFQGRLSRSELRPLRRITRFWISRNSLTTAKNLGQLRSAKELNLAGNRIECVTTIDVPKGVEQLNLAHNKIRNFTDVLDLKNLPSLRELHLSDPDYGENPICQLCNYGVALVQYFKQLELVDLQSIDVEMVRESDAIWKRKRLYYDMQAESVRRQGDNAVQIARAFFLEQRRNFYEGVRCVSGQLVLASSVEGYEWERMVEYLVRVSWENFKAEEFQHVNALQVSRVSKIHANNGSPLFPFLHGGSGAAPGAIGGSTAAAASSSLSQESHFSKSLALSRKGTEWGKKLAEELREDRNAGESEKQSKYLFMVLPIGEGSASTSSRKNVGGAAGAAAGETKGDEDHGDGETEINHHQDSSSCSESLTVDEQEQILAMQQTEKEIEDEKALKIEARFQRILKSGNVGVREDHNLMSRDTPSRAKGRHGNGDQQFSSCSAIDSEYGGGTGANGSRPVTHAERKRQEQKKREEMINEWTQSVTKQLHEAVRESGGEVFAPDDMARPAGKWPTAGPTIDEAEQLFLTLEGGGGGNAGGGVEGSPGGYGRAGAGAGSRPGTVSNNSALQATSALLTSQNWSPYATEFCVFLTNSVAVALYPVLQQFAESDFAQSVFGGEQLDRMSCSQKSSGIGSADTLKKRYLGGAELLVCQAFGMQNELPDVADPFFHYQKESGGASSFGRSTSLAGGGGSSFSSVSGAAGGPSSSPGYDVPGAPAPPAGGTMQNLSNASSFQTASNVRPSTRAPPCGLFSRHHYLFPPMDSEQTYVSSDPRQKIWRFRDASRCEPAFLLQLEFVYDSETEKIECNLVGKNADVGDATKVQSQEKMLSCSAPESVQPTATSLPGDHVDTHTSSTTTALREFAFLVTTVFAHTLAERVLTRTGAGAPARPSLTGGPPSSTSASAAYDVFFETASGALPSHFRPTTTPSVNFNQKTVFDHMTNSHPLGSHTRTHFRVGQFSSAEDLASAWDLNATSDSRTVTQRATLERAVLRERQRILLSLHRVESAQIESITYVNLWGANLRRLSKDCFVGLHKLKTLVLGMNRFVSAAEDLGSSWSCEIVDLSWNFLKPSSRPSSSSICTSSTASEQRPSTSQTERRLFPNCKRLHLTGNAEFHLGTLLHTAAIAEGGLDEWAPKVEELLIDVPEGVFESGSGAVGGHPSRGSCNPYHSAEMQRLLVATHPSLKLVNSMKVILLITNSVVQPPQVVTATAASAVADHDELGGGHKNDASRAAVGLSLGLGGDSADLTENAASASASSDPFRPAAFPTPGAPRAGGGAGKSGCHLSLSPLKEGDGSRIQTSVLGLGVSGGSPTRRRSPAKDLLSGAVSGGAGGGGTASLVRENSNSVGDVSLNASRKTLNVTQMVQQRRAKMQARYSSSSVPLSSSASSSDGRSAAVGAGDVQPNSINNDVPCRSSDEEEDASPDDDADLPAFLCSVLDLADGDEKTSYPRPGPCATAATDFFFQNLQHLIVSNIGLVSLQSSSSFSSTAPSYSISQLCVAQRLETLDISCNKLQSLKGLEAFRQLKQLDASQNAIYCDVLPSLPAGLEFLNLSQNCVKSLAFQVLGDRNRASADHLHTVGIAAPTSYPGLRALYLGDNLLSDMRELQVLPRLFPKLAILELRGNPMCLRADSSVSRDLLDRALLKSCAELVVRKRESTTQVFKKSIEEDAKINAGGEDVDVDAAADEPGSSVSQPQSLAYYERDDQLLENSEDSPGQLSPSSSSDGAGDDHGAPKAFTSLEGRDGDGEGEEGPQEGDNLNDEGHEDQSTTFFDDSCTRLEDRTLRKQKREERRRQREQDRLAKQKAKRESQAVAKPIGRGDVMPKVGMDYSYAASLSSAGTSRPSSSSSASLSLEVMQKAAGARENADGGGKSKRRTNKAASMTAEDLREQELGRNVWGTGRDAHVEHDLQKFFPTERADGSRSGSSTSASAAGAAENDANVRRAGAHAHAPDLLEGADGIDLQIKLAPADDQRREHQVAPADPRGVRNRNHLRVSKLYRLSLIYLLRDSLQYLDGMSITDAELKAAWQTFRTTLTPDLLLQQSGCFYHAKLRALTALNLTSAKLSDLSDGILSDRGIGVVVAATASGSSGATAGGGGVGATTAGGSLTDDEPAAPTPAPNENTASTTTTTSSSTTLRKEQAPFRSLKKLRALILNHNKIRFTDAFSFFQEQRINPTNSSTLHPHGINVDAPALEEIFLTHNRLSSLDCFSAVKNLKLLKLDFNRVSALEAIQLMVPRITVGEKLQETTTRRKRMVKMEELLESMCHTISLARNPVARKPFYRFTLCQHLAALEIIDGRKVTQEDRLGAWGCATRQLILY